MEDLVPEDNFYRKLQTVLDLQFLYKKTEKYYGSEGQESIDPVVFLKFCLVGYLNNIISDRKLVNYCSDSLAIRLFLGYDLDEKLPSHSTISRTRKLYEETIFEQVFQTVLRLGMLMAATAFNLKKLLKYAQKPPKSCANLMKIATKTRESLRFYLHLILGLHTCHISNLKI